MRRTAGGFLHPSEKWRLGVLNAERLASDPAGVSRVAESDSVWDYLPNEPDIDINTYHRQYDFGDARDTAVPDVWTENHVTTGSARVPLTVRAWESGGHAYTWSGDGDGDYVQYQETNVSYDSSGDSPSDLWAAFQFRPATVISDDAEMFVGFAQEDTDILGNNAPRIGFQSDNGFWKITVNEGAGGFRSEQSVSMDENEMHDVAVHVNWIDGQAKYYVLVNGQEATSFLGEGFWGGDHTESTPRTQLRLTIYSKNNVAGGAAAIYLNYLKEIWSK